MAGKFRLRQENGAAGILVLADGTCFHGTACGAMGEAVGELCYNTAMSGYQEILSDPASAGQIVNFTFPHIGNVGANPEDSEGDTRHAAGCVLAADITGPSSFRATEGFSEWLRERGIVGIAGVDTRAVIRHLRTKGVQGAVIAHDRNGRFDVPALVAKAKNAPGLVGQDLAEQAGTATATEWTEGLWKLGEGFPEEGGAGRPHVAVLDFGGRKDACRELVSAGARVTLLPPASSWADVDAAGADGLFLSDGPGDPRVTATRVLPVVRAWLDSGRPLFATGFGFQLLALALGGEVEAVETAHFGGSHPVSALDTGHVEVSALSGRFRVVRATLPEGVGETHRSLYDESICGIRVAGAPVSGVQHRPECAPHRERVHPLYTRFVAQLQGR